MFDFFVPLDTGVAYFISKSALEFPMTFIFTLLQFVIAFFMINMQVRGLFINLILYNFFNLLRLLPFYRETFGILCWQLSA